MKSLADWLNHLERLHPRPIDMGLERVEKVRAAMGLSLNVPLLTVGGTNGKGSVCAFLEAILRQAGYRTGLYTSPHLVRYNERVRIDGAEVEDATLVAGFERIDAARAGTSLTYFEFGTLAAVSAFVDAGVEVAILEVGLGGRLDAVNVFDPDCAIVVSVDLDHMNFLGSTRESIGREKAGIFRPGKPAIYGANDPPQSLLRHAASIGARLLIAGRDFGFEQTPQQWRYWGPESVRAGLPHPSLRGAHQLGNAAAAIAALDEVRAGLPVHMQALRTGLVTAAPAARFQVLPGRPVIVLDVAHNPHAARALAQNLRAQGRFNRTLAVFAMLADKDIAGVVAAVKDQVSEWCIAGLGGDRGSSASTVAAIVAEADPGKAAHAFDSPDAAYAFARGAASVDDRIAVFGSFHTVSEVLVAHDAARPKT
ncbi:MAG: bifunctional tetrahydrofolate synthase/dihydrofolate synthase [Betaproteobacteria bacterium]|nr:MAG: bifunctional tetrahydrofolate synthase/dihydrofolate synthase [Betaproteobacteria bacterium]